MVPSRDVRYFKPLESRRRRILATEDVLPAHCYQLPLFNKLWMDTRGWPIRGWILQQLTKLSAHRVTDSELIVFADSDIQFIRDLRIDQFFKGDQFRMICLPGEKQSGRHLNWHNRAGELLNIGTGYQGNDYIGQLVCWRRSNLVQLHDHIETVTRRPWHTEVMRSWDLSEYILYGAFVDKVLGREQAGHFYDDNDLCHCCWFQHEADELASGEASVSPRAIALLIQSNLGLDIRSEHAVASTLMRPGVLGGQAA